MKRIYFCLFVLAFIATSGCGSAGRGEHCGDNDHRSVDCAEGLTCVWQNSIQRQVCAAPGDEATHCETDRSCNGKDIYCFSNTCSTERNEDELCVEDRQCKGELVCYKEIQFPKIGHCWTKEKADALTQCHTECLEDYNTSCLKECRDERSETGEGEVGCDETCELVEDSRAWHTENTKCNLKCR